VGVLALVDDLEIAVAALAGLGTGNAVVAVDLVQGELFVVAAHQAGGAGGVPFGIAQGAMGVAQVFHGAIGTNDAGHRQVAAHRADAAGFHRRQARGIELGGESGEQDLQGGSDQRQTRQVVLVRFAGEELVSEFLQPFAAGDHERGEDFAQSLGGIVIDQLDDPPQSVAPSRGPREGGGGERRHAVNAGAFEGFGVRQFGIGHFLQGLVLGAGQAAHEGQPFAQAVVLGQGVEALGAIEEDALRIGQTDGWNVGGGGGRSEKLGRHGVVKKRERGDDHPCAPETQGNFICRSPGDTRHDDAAWPRHGSPCHTTWRGWCP